MKKRICILYTGGTIGMVPSEKGYVPSSGAFLDLLRAIPDLYWADMPEWDVVEFEPLLDSSDITVREWNQIGAAIAARYDDYDGFDGVLRLGNVFYDGEHLKARHFYRLADSTRADPK